MQKILIVMATKRPALSADRPNNNGVTVNLVRETYLKKLTRFGLVPIFVSPLMAKKTIDSLYRECRGALFIGGGDFDAQHYGQTNHPKNNRLEPARDQLELYLLKKILRDRKPFLGICRGAQALAIAGKGTLHQHLPDLKLKEKHSAKIYTELFAKNNGHKIYIDTVSRAYKILRATSLKVNSAHHQAVRAVGANFRVAAASKEGTTEIIEHRDPRYFCFGLQCHPEAMKNSKMDRFFAEFSKAVRTGK